jgi:hypothetical protein
VPARVAQRVATTPISVRFSPAPTSSLLDGGGACIIGLSGRWRARRPGEEVPSVNPMGTSRAFPTTCLLL